MITRNYYASMCATAIVDGEGPASLSIRDISGKYLIPENNQVLGGGSQGSRPNLSLMPKQVSNSVGLCFGTSDAEESVEDYTLSFANFGSVAGAYQQPVYNAENNNYTITRRFVLSNTTASAITVKEFGILGLMSADYTYGTTQANILLYRKKLDNEFTIEANETVNFDLTVTYNMPVEYAPYVPA